MHQGTSVTLNRVKKPNLTKYLIAKIFKNTHKLFKLKHIGNPLTEWLSTFRQIVFIVFEALWCTLKNQYDPKPAQGVASS